MISLNFIYFAPYFDQITCILLFTKMKELLENSAFSAEFWVCKILVVSTVIESRDTVMETS